MVLLTPYPTQSPASMAKGSVLLWRRTYGRLTPILLLLLLSGRPEGTSVGPPGKPRLISCRSPEKETFTCQWEPGSSGGLATQHALYYHTENSEKVFECPDYETAGENSCFFNKTYTSIWVSYNITVVARNALGNSCSDSIDVDVMNIVQPHHPENVTVTLEDGDNPYLQVKWEKPHRVDTRSGWVTLSYELCVKREKDNKSELHFAGQQKHFRIFRPIPGEVYVVKVRCKPDHGYWSEWSSPAFMKVPDYIPREKSMWILMAVFTSFILLILAWALVLKKSSVKHFFLPPVPGPKIKGFDSHLLKKGKSEEIFSVLISQGFPPTSDGEDLLVEYLEVSEGLQQDPAPTALPEAQEQQRDRSPAPIADSGQGSSVHHTLQVKSGEESGTRSVKQTPAFSGPLVTSSNSSQAPKPDGKANTISSSSSSSRPSCVQGTLYVAEVLIEGLPPATEQDRQVTPAGVSPCNSPVDSDYTQDESGLSGNRGTAQRPDVSPSAFKPTEYVEVQNVNQEDRLILRPKAKEDIGDLWQVGLRGQEYSKVSELINNHLLLLERGSTSAGPSYGATEGPVEGRAQQQPAKPTLQQGLNGYVDTGSMLAPY
uniref:Prolactin receptor n=1 Tax=Paramormyrops kingsleyae TaxID=1676925 RepID=A0A3B3RY17_9TELE|nr:prolactin receptor-like [Paramormyrops kingsleyae]